MRFSAPASTRFHGSYEGGLFDHSLNVYECLCDFIKRPRFKDKYGFTFSEESLAIVALLHDICKTNFYKTEMRNVNKYPPVKTGGYLLRHAAKGTLVLAAASLCSDIIVDKKNLNMNGNFAQIKNFKKGRYLICTKVRFP